jgi:DNA-binding SARP family transcriptional activator
MLRLRLFGTLCAAVDDDQGGTQELVLTGRPAGLLAFMALAQGRFFTRTELATALWSERADGVSAGCFNTVLWRLRRVLDATCVPAARLITSDHRGGLGLDPQTRLQLDVFAFQRLVEPVLQKPLDSCRPEDVQALREGVQLYQGDVLAGFTDAWALRERERHRRLLLNALGRLIQLATLAGDWESGIQHAQTILDHDPLREDVHRELMRLYLHNGQRALALRQFEHCRAALKRELAIQPMRETQALYHDIADAALGLRAAPNDAATAPAAFEMPASARALVQSALEHLGAADRQLQLSLPLLPD